MSQIKMEVPESILVQVRIVKEVTYRGHTYQTGCVTKLPASLARLMVDQGYAVGEHRGAEIGNSKRRFV